MRIAESEKIKKTFAFNVDIFRESFVGKFLLTNIEKYFIIVFVAADG